MIPVVKVEAHESALLFDLGGRYGRDVFDRYRAALVGRAKFVTTPRKCNRATDAERAAQAVAALQAAGFAVEADDEARVVLGRGASKIKARADKAAAGVARAQERLQERGGAFRGDFQAEGVAFAAGRRSALLLDDMGLGKTLQLVLGSDPDEWQVVSAPASVVGQWAAEVAKWTELQVRTLGDAAAFEWPAPGEVLVCSHDRIPPAPVVVKERLADFYAAAARWLAAGLAGRLLPRVPQLRAALPAAKPPGPGRVTLDEIHAFKTAKSDRARSAKHIVRLAFGAGGTAIGMTGTVIQNRPIELRTILDVLDLFEEAFGTYGAFCRAFGGPEAVRSAHAKAGPAVAEALARVGLRRLKTEVAADLPPKTVERRWVQLDGEGAALASRMEEIIRARVAADEQAAGRPLTAEEHEEVLRRALDATSDVGEMSAARRVIALAVLASPEVQAAIAEAEADGDALIVASSSVEPLRALAGRPGWGMIAGEVAEAERTRVREDFQAARLARLALSIRAGGAGLNLTRACRMFIIGGDWNPALNVQTEDRIWRIGQTRPCRVMYFTADCWVERRQVDLCTTKQAMSDAALSPLVGRAPTAPVAPDLAAVRAPAPPPVAQQEAPQAVAAPSAPSGWLPLDDALRSRLERLAKRGHSLSRWLLRTFTGAVPPRVGPDAHSRRPTLDLLAEHAARLAAEDAADAAARRPARTPAEEHAARALAQLAAADADHARERNGEGFAASTQDGHRLAARVAELGGLRDDEWERALEIARLHRRQVGDDARK